MTTAAVDHIPRPLLGRLILLRGNPFPYQSIVLVTKGKDGPVVQIITGARSLPFTGKAPE